ncbi:hypothetical protein HMI55_006210 [Coelomomyces lativittatus]|nr:hypothetical protein HMI56_006391 [Coelomomyces lativittatus]KAJ1512494.1 hypothetical protein HMI55_006210 [Coelomomyces lativittatus]
MPYQSFMVCAIRAGSLATLTWMSFLAFVSMHMEKNPDKNNRPLDFALVLGLLPSFLVGYFLAKLRRNFLLNACENLILRCKQRTSVEPHNDSHPGKVGASDVVSSEFIEKFSQDPFVIKYVKTMNNVELIGRYLVQMKKYQIADCWYRVALTHHQVSALAHILCYHFMEVQRATNYQDNFGSIETDWEALSRFEPYFYLRFICFRQKMESDKQSATANIANHGDKLDLLQYVEFRKSYQLAKKYHARCIDSIQQFWILFLVQNVSFRGFQTALRTINTNTKMADSFYKNLLFRYPKATHILNAYSNFAALVLNDSDTAEHYHQLAINAQAREAEMQSEGMSLGGLLGAPSNNAVVTINIEGVILEVNAIALQMFGYHSKNDLLQRKINALMPFPYKLVHDQFLEKYKKTGVKNILGVRQNLFGLHLHGYAFIVDIQIVELKRRELTFAGLITQHTTEKEKACICINREGLIQFFTKPVLSMFGYTPQELIGSNVKILMTKEYASQHDIYLSTYLETGEGRVIGNGMRMVMGMHKCGKFISIGLEVRKDTVAGEIYYFGTLVDMEELVGEILINAYGEIVTCNEDTTALLGYQLNEMVGNNIKMIMPEPYASFHDMYLERYRKTKKGLIVDSPEGRILTVRNKLGSCFAVNLIVKKLENTSELLYQGLMRRLPAGELEDKSGDTKSI